MTITWRISYSKGSINLSDEELAKQLMPILGLDEDEYKVHKNFIEGTPSVITFNYWISGTRLAVYDIRILNNSEANEIEIRIRLYKLFVIPVIFPLIGLFTGFEFISFSISLIAYLLSVLFIGLFALFELEGDKTRIRNKIKTLDASANRNL